MNNVCLFYFYYIYVTFQWLPWSWCFWIGLSIHTHSTACLERVNDLVIEKTFLFHRSWSFKKKKVIKMNIDDASVRCNNLSLTTSGCTRNELASISLASLLYSVYAMLLILYIFEAFRMSGNRWKSLKWFHVLLFCSKLFYQRWNECTTALSKIANRKQ